MTKEEVIKLITSDPDKAHTELMKYAKDSDALDQYNPEKHSIITDTAKRPDKTITDKDDNYVKTEYVARIAIPLQKLIAQRAAAFLCANPIQLNATPKEGSEQTLYNALVKTWEDNKLDFKSMDLAEKMMAETEVAELWYTEEAPDYWTNEGIKAKYRFRMRILAPSLGDTLLPVKDIYGDLIAFGRYYEITLNTDKAEQHLDVYTDDIIYKGIKGEQNWEFTPENNPIGKIPIIYYSQDKPEWSDVQTMIDRLETKMSNHADTNDYFDSPILLVSGSITSMPDKGGSGKVVEAEANADAKYLSWDHAPESTKMEIENLIRFIYSCTDTPDISFENLKGLGTTSGFALEMMFMGAHLKAAKKAGIFGEGIQRRINYLKAAIVKITTIKEDAEVGGKVVSLTKPLTDALRLQVKPTFDFFLPKDIEQAVNYLSTAVTSGIISKKTAIAKNPLVEDAEAEEKQLEKEGKEADSNPQNLNKLFNVA
jgi:SPP1 family phage portal protein